MSLADVVAETLAISPDEVGEDAGLNRTRNWDSLHQMIVLNEVERVFDVQFELDEMTEATTLARIRALLTARGREAA